MLVRVKITITNHPPLLTLAGIPPSINCKRMNNHGSLVSACVLARLSRKIIGRLTEFDRELIVITAQLSVAIRKALAPLNDNEEQS